MTSLFLKAKHWQLFILFFGLPFVLNIFLMAYMVRGFANNAEFTPGWAFAFVVPVIVIAMASVMLWTWSMAIGLQPRLPEGITMKVKKFKFFFFFPIVYILIFLSFFFFMFGSAMTGTEPDGFMIYGFFIIFPVHLFAMFCMFYTIYFAAKTIKTIEIMMPAKFGDFAGEFFMLWFYPIGVWIIQPRVNKIVNQAAPGDSGN